MAGVLAPAARHNGARAIGSVGTGGGWTTGQAAGYFQEDFMAAVNALTRSGVHAASTVSENLLAAAYSDTLSTFTLKSLSSSSIVNGLLSRLAYPSGSH